LRVFAERSVRRVSAGNDNTFGIFQVAGGKGQEIVSVIIAPNQVDTVFASPDICVACPRLHMRVCMRQHFVSLELRPVGSKIKIDMMKTGRGIKGYRMTRLRIIDVHYPALDPSGMVCSMNEYLGFGEGILPG
jgi:hypothetical protein